VIAKKLGFPTVKALRDSIPRIPALHPKSREEILDEYRHTLPDVGQASDAVRKTAEGKARGGCRSRHFSRKKRLPTTTKGTPDGSRPGHVFVNTYDFANQLTIKQRVDCVSRGIPGHHMQISIAQELPDLPPFRQQASYTAFQEGWRSIRKGWVRRSGSIRILTRTTDVSTTRCSARFVW